MEKVRPKTVKSVFFLCMRYLIALIVLLSPWLLIIGLSEGAWYTNDHPVFVVPLILFIVYLWAKD